MTSTEDKRIAPGERTRNYIYNIIESDEPWKGRMLFTGPDGNCDHRVTVEPDHRHIGIGTMSVEGTSEADYLWRPASSTPFPRPRTANVGEIGWEVPRRTDWSMPLTGRQVILGDFRQECENRHSHLYQNPWYPGPGEEIIPGTDASMVMNVYRPHTAPAHAQSGLDDQESTSTDTAQNYAY
ncbi:protein SPMIP2-like [Saccostrea echinata]|uniref:protein SPMIP2-like n=1 Tax=Saccostrea echinata TaxID=191078 RepID=UPI002A8366AB|nr:protein SPMIP2-like [Saccostrea echinata]XP_061191315.1 protein SPMIP2-like [Saccostrea echinata]